MLDLDNPLSCLEAASKLPEPGVDVLILSAGSVKLSDFNRLNPQLELTPAYCSSVLGHAIFIEEAIKLGRVKEGARVICSGGELQRSVPLFTGFQPYPKTHLRWKSHVSGGVGDGGISMLPRDTSVI